MKFNILEDIVSNSQKQAFIVKNPVLKFFLIFFFDLNERLRGSFWTIQTMPQEVQSCVWQFWRLRNNISRERRKNADLSNKFQNPLGQDISRTKNLSSY